MNEESEEYDEIVVDRIRNRMKERLEPKTMLNNRINLVIMQVQVEQDDKYQRTNNSDIASLPINNNCFEILQNTAKRNITIYNNTNSNNNHHHSNITSITKSSISPTFLSCTIKQPPLKCICPSIV